MKKPESKKPESKISIGVPFGIVRSKTCFFASVAAAGFLSCLACMGCNDAPAKVLGGPDVVVDSANDSPRIEASSTVGVASPLLQDTKTISGGKNAATSGGLREQNESQETEEDGVLGRAARIFNKAKSKSGDTASDASQWVQEKLSGAADAGGQTADDTLKWANETFESLKSNGLTSAKNTSEWLGQDYTNMYYWEYKVITIGGRDEQLAAKLNEFGKLGWNCFNVETTTSGTRFYFKKQTFSYMRHLPFKDIIKLVPAMGSEQK